MRKGQLVKHKGCGKVVKLDALRASMLNDGDRVNCPSCEEFMGREDLE